MTKGAQYQYFKKYIFSAPCQRGLKARNELVSDGHPSDSGSGTEVINPDTGNSSDELISPIDSFEIPAPGDKVLMLDRNTGPL